MGRSSVTTAHAGWQPGGIIGNLARSDPSSIKNNKQKTINIKTINKKTIYVRRMSKHFIENKKIILEMT